MPLIIKYIVLIPGCIFEVNKITYSNIRPNVNKHNKEVYNVSLGGGALQPMKY